MENKEYKVLDKGFVRVDKVCASDLDVVRSARISYGQGSKGEEKDKKLIEYLIKHEHMSPFEHTFFRFHIKAPIFVARQWFRHRIGVGINEISLRYTEHKEDEFYVPKEIRFQDKKNKQGSVTIDEILSKPEYQNEKDEFELLYKEINDEAIKVIEQAYDLSSKMYDMLLRLGVARELARIVLPLGTYTQFYWTCNARSLMHFLKLRLDKHAQYEIREYAKVLFRIFKEHMPWTAEAFEKFVLNS